MLDPKLIRNSIETVALQIKKRGMVIDIAKFNDLEEKRKSLQVKMQELQNERNVRSKEVGLLKAQGKEAGDLLKQLKEQSEALKQFEEKFSNVQGELDDFLFRIPNIPHDSVPLGQTEEDNQVIRTSGTPRQFSFTPKDHVELGANQGRMDFETAAKISGARFVVLRGVFAKLQRALIQFMLDLHTKEHGYQEIYVPAIVNADCLFGTGQLPNLKEDVFAVSGEGERYLIPTSEIPVTNSVREMIIEENQLPIRYVCYSPCFRSEAGSYGKDLRGMIRNHQFEKVELVHIVKPQDSYQALEVLTQHAETVLQRLELPFRTVALCTADLGFAASKTYDIEVWLPGQNRYREISSCSNTESFQARRMKTRWRDTDGKIDFVHTLNGLGLAVGRTLIAIIENYQDELGRIHLPKALQPYMDGLTVME